VVTYLVAAVGAAIMVGILLVPAVFIVVMYAIVSMLK